MANLPRLTRGLAPTDLISPRNEKHALPRVHPAGRTPPPEDVSQTSDRTLTCRDCWLPYTFAEGEQFFYLDGGSTGRPARHSAMATATEGCPAALAAAISPVTEPRGAHAPHSG